MNKALITVCICTILFGCQFEDKEMNQIIEKMNSVEEQSERLVSRIDELEAGYDKYKIKIIELTKENENFKILIENNSKDQNPLSETNKEAILMLSSEISELQKTLGAFIDHVNERSDVQDFIAENTGNNIKNLEYQQKLIDTLSKRISLNLEMIQNIATYTGMKN